MIYGDIIDGAKQDWLALIVPQERIFFIYLLSAGLLAIATYFYYRVMAKGVKPEGIDDKTLGQYIFDKESFTHKSAWQDYKYFIVNALIYAGIISQLFITFHLVVNALTLAFYNIFGPMDTPLFENNIWTLTLYTIFSIIIIDFTTFITHYLQHKVPILWEFHKVHHSAEVLNPLTVYRMHPVDMFFTNILGVLLLSGLFAGYFYMAQTEPKEFQIASLNIFLFAFYIFGYNLRHSHIWLNYPKWLSNIFISPAQHQIHHSSAEKHWDKNMGFIFSFWDGLFKTLYIPEKYEKLTYGINGKKLNPFDSVWDMYMQPFKKAWELLSEPKNGQSAFEKKIFVGGVLLAILVGYGVLLTFDKNSQAAQNAIPYMQDMTWTEVDRAIANGYNTVIIPTGGTEQNGPHVILGKHNYVVRHTAGEIAKAIGNTLVAPVIAHVPEGDITPEPTIHMQYPGTITLPETHFEKLLEWTARSYKQHGFQNIFFIGDSHANQNPQNRVAEKLSKEWGSFMTVRHIGDYYYENGQTNWLLSQGFTQGEIGGHAGIRDTSEMLYVAAHGVRKNPYFKPETDDQGFSGAYKKANKRIGKKMIELKVNAAVNEIKPFLGQLRQGE